MPAVAVLVDTDPAECRRRNRARDRPVPAPVLEGQLRRMRAVVAEIRGEGWDLVTTARHAQPEASHTPGARTAASQQRQRPVRMSLVLQLSRFPWGEDAAGPACWLSAVAGAAAEAGLRGIALMDHLIQIPQVGRAWEPIPEPWVTLGMLAGLDTRLRLGTLVSPATFRPPGILAKSAATLDTLSSGRAFVGIGAGWWEREHTAYGLAFPPAASGWTCSRSPIETHAGPVAATGTKPYAGQRVSLPETTCYPRPVSDVPIVVGGSGERRTLAIAARLGDACNLPSDDGRPGPQGRGAPPALPKGRARPGGGRRDCPGRPRRRPGPRRCRRSGWSGCAAGRQPRPTPSSITREPPMSTSAVTGCWLTAA